MKKRNWIKIKSSKTVDGKSIPKLNYPKDKVAVHVYMCDGEGLFCIFTAHRENNHWVSYDHFENVFRLYQQPKLITHWMHLQQHPTNKGKK